MKLSSSVSFFYILEVYSSTNKDTLYVCRWEIQTTFSFVQLVWAIWLHAHSSISWAQHSWCSPAATVGVHCQYQTCCKSSVLHVSAVIGVILPCCGRSLALDAPPSWGLTGIWTAFERSSKSSFKIRHFGTYVLSGGPLIYREDLWFFREKSLYSRYVS